MSTLSIAEARAALSQAEAAQAKERRTALAADLAAVRSELRTARKTFDKLSKEVMEGQANLDNVRGNIIAVSDALSRLQTVKPACADLLPDDEEVVEWRTHCATLETRLEQLRAKRLALPNTEALRIDGVNLRQRIQQLEFAENNLLNELSGTLAQNRVGGVLAPQ